MDKMLLVDNHNFTLDDRISGPALAVAVGVEFIFSLVSNLFVLIFTLCHPKTLKQPSIIFLTNFVLVNLMVTVMVMPFTIITASIGEWVFGSSVKGKHGFCQFTGFIFAMGVQLVLLNLAAISIDRFLFIVKPLVHKRYMKTLVAAVIVIIMWLLAALVNIPPYLGLGQYAFGQFTATCLQVWVGHRDYVAYLCVIVLIVILTITITTLWTFCFTRNFIKTTTYLPTKVNGSHMGTVTNGRAGDNIARHIYTRRMRKLVGIFGLMLIFTFVSFIPSIIAAVAGIAVGTENIPAPVFAIVILSFFVNSIANPLIQVYFRRDVNEFVIHVYKKIVCVVREGNTSEATLVGETSYTNTSQSATSESKLATQASNISLDEI